LEAVDEEGKGAPSPELTKVQFLCHDGFTNSPLPCPLHAGASQRVRRCVAELHKNSGPGISYHSKDGEEIIFCGQLFCSICVDDMRKKNDATMSEELITPLRIHNRRDREVYNLEYEFYSRMCPVHQQHFFGKLQATLETYVLKNLTEDVNDIILTATTDSSPEETATDPQVAPMNDLVALLATPEPSTALTEDPAVGNTKVVTTDQNVNGEIETDEVEPEVDSAVDIDSKPEAVATEPEVSTLNDLVEAVEDQDTNVIHEDPEGGRSNVVAVDQVNGEIESKDDEPEVEVADDDIPKNNADTTCTTTSASANVEHNDEEFNLRPEDEVMDNNDPRIYNYVSCSVPCVYYNFHHVVFTHCI